MKVQAGGKTLRNITMASQATFRRAPCPSISAWAMQEIESVQVTWPSGKTQRVEGEVASNTLLNITEKLPPFSRLPRFPCDLAPLRLCVEKLMRGCRRASTQGGKAEASLDCGKHLVCSNLSGWRTSLCFNAKALKGAETQKKPGKSRTGPSLLAAVFPPRSAMPKLPTFCDLCSSVVAVAPSDRSKDFSDSLKESHGSIRIYNRRIYSYMRMDHLQEIANESEYRTKVMQQKLGYTAKGLQRMCNRNLGMPPSQCLIRQRCLRAIELHLAGVPYKVLLDKLKIKSSGHFCRTSNTFLAHRS